MNGEADAEIRNGHQEPILVFFCNNTNNANIRTTDGIIEHIPYDLTNFFIIAKHVWQRIVPSPGNVKTFHAGSRGKFFHHMGDAIIDILFFIFAMNGRLIAARHGEMRLEQGCHPFLIPRNCFESVRQFFCRLAIHAARDIMNKFLKTGKQGTKLTADIRKKFIFLFFERFDFEFFLNCPFGLQFISKTSEEQYSKKNYNSKNGSVEEPFR